MAVVVSDVKLPDRARARIEQEANIQRVQKPHDIRGAIPLWDPTNPAKFPPYIFREYPKMPLLDGNKPIVIDDSGGVLVFYDASDEVEFKDLNPEVAEEIERNAPAKQMSERYVEMEEENAKLRAKLAALGIDVEESAKDGGLQAVIRKDEPDAEDPNLGLKSQVKAAADRASNGNKANPLRKHSDS